MRTSLGGLMRRLFSSTADRNAVRGLVIGDRAGPGLRSAVSAAVACMRGGPVDLLLTGPSVAAHAEQAAKWARVNRVLIATCKHNLAEVIAPVVVKQIHAVGYTHVLAPCTSYGKDLLPRVAGILDVSPLSDIVKVVDGTDDTFVRPIYAGNALATVRSTDYVKVITVRATAFDPIYDKQEEATTAIEAVDISSEEAANISSDWVSLESTETERPELSTARVVVSGGRGLQSEGNFKLLERLADRLGGAVGATRAAVDAGMVPNDMQIGQTGKVVAPELYIAIGISGAMQHLAGMKDSKVIVAINKDSEAPIFQVADYGLVMDLFKAVPELDERLDGLGFKAPNQN